MIRNALHKEIVLMRVIGMKNLNPTMQQIVYFPVYLSLEDWRGSQY